MVGRAGRSADRTHLFDAKLYESIWIEEGLCFLVEEGLVGGTTAFGHEEKLVFRSGGGEEIDLGWKIGLGVDLVEHRQRRDLREA